MKTRAEIEQSLENELPTLTDAQRRALVEACLRAETRDPSAFDRIPTFRSGMKDLLNFHRISDDPHESLR